MTHQLYEIAVSARCYIAPDRVAGAGDRDATLAAAIVDRRVAVDAVWLHWLAYIGAMEAARR